MPSKKMIRNTGVGKKRLRGSLLGSVEQRRTTVLRSEGRSAAHRTVYTNIIVSPSSNCVNRTLRRANYAPRTLHEATTRSTSFQLVSNRCSVDSTAQYRRAIAEYTWFRFVLRRVAAVMKRMTTACGRVKSGRKASAAGARVHRTPPLMVAR